MIEDDGQFDQEDNGSPDEISFYEDDYEQQPPADIVTYNELRSCADLFRMYDKDILEISPEFQRDSVWKTAAQTRFIDSLIKGLPIPSMCFSLDYKTQKWQVIDGLQRMSSIIKFLGDDKWKLSTLDDIDKRISGKNSQLFKNEELPEHELFSRVENLTLPITVIRCDYSKKTHTEYLFTIFHRLNTGGTKLNNQEIRNCIFSGRLNSALKSFNENLMWNEIARHNPRESDRFRSIELILRFLAFIDSADSYKGVLSKFLNDYMRANRNPSEDFIDNRKEIFERTVNVMYRKLEVQDEERLSASVMEALMYGLAVNIDNVETMPDQELRHRYEELKADESLSRDYLSGGVGKREKVDSRLQAARRAFE